MLAVDMFILGVRQKTHFDSGRVVLKAKQADDLPANVQ